MDLFVEPTISFSLLYGLLINGAWQTTGHMVRSNNTSDCGINRKPDNGSLRMGAASPLSDPRSRWSVW
jgi:hypothetical protein